jgi:Arc/MetJ-type ribon-helix-helix transcriptional regulator
VWANVPAVPGIPASSGRETHPEVLAAPHATLPRSRPVLVARDVPCLLRAHFSTATIHLDGSGNPSGCLMSETEKITINLGLVDLGQIDLLVQESVYANRSDFIRTAIRNQLTKHDDAVRETVARRTLILGLQHFARHDLEKVRASGARLEIKVLGLATIADDVTPELAADTIESVQVLGAFRASSAVRRALADRIR